MAEKFVLVTFGCQQDFSAQQSTSWYNRILELEILLKEHGHQVLDDKSLDQLEPDSIVLIAGSMSCKDFLKRCLPLLERSASLCVVLDALQYRSQILPTLADFAERDVQLLVTGSVRTLVQAKRHVRSAFPKADNSMTSAIFADIDSDDPLILTFAGTKPEEAGSLLLPGGFILPFVETLRQGCARETMEECFFNPHASGDHDRFTYLIDPACFELIDEQSEVGRDERGHVIENGFAWFVPKEVQAQVIASVSGGDEVVPGTAKFRRVSEVLAGKVAYDHRHLIVRSMARLAEKKILARFAEAGN